MSSDTFVMKSKGGPVLFLAFVSVFLLGQQVGLGASLSLQKTLTGAQQLIQEGNLTAARRLLTQAFTDFPDQASIHNLLGVVEVQEGNLAAAESHFAKAVALFPRYEGAYLNWGRLYTEQAETDPRAADQAIAIYKRLLTVHPASREAKYQLAALFNRKGHFRDSLQYLNQIPISQQIESHALALFCANYVATGEENKAKQAAHRLMENSDLTEEDVISILPVLAAHQAQGLAEQLLQVLHRRGLGSFNTLYWQGLIYKQQGKLGPAREVFLRTAELKPDNVPILLELARVAEKQKDYDGSLSYLAHARDLEPENAAIHFFFGMVCVEKNLVEEAYLSLKKAAGLNPENPYYNYAAGAAAYEKTLYWEAVDYFQKFCQLKSESVQGRLALGMSYFHNRDRDRAHQELSFTSNYPQTAATAHYFLGRMANQEGDLVGAFRELQRALAIRPEFADAYAELGNLHLKQKEHAKAEQALTKALDLESDNYRANLFLLMVYSRTGDPRAKAQNRRFSALKKKRKAKMKELYRNIEVRRPD